MLILAIFIHQKKSTSVKVMIWRIRLVLVKLPVEWGIEMIRIGLESTGFQTKLAEYSKREKEEEIPRIISPLLICSDRGRRDRILEGGGGLRAFRVWLRWEVDDGPDRWAPPISGREEGERAARLGKLTWPGVLRPERERDLGRLSAQSQKRILKPFSF